MVLRDVAASTTSEESRPPPNHETHGSLSGQSKDNARIRDKGSKPMKL